MKAYLTLACIASLGAASVAPLAYADSVTIREVDPEPTNSIVIQEREEPDVIIREKKKKVVIKEREDPSITIRSPITID